MYSSIVTLIDLVYRAGKNYWPQIFKSVNMLLKKKDA